MKDHFHPLTEFGRVGDIVERTLDKVFNETLPTAWRRTTGSGDIIPNCDLIEEEDHFLLKAEVPGVKKEDLDISVSDDSITLKGEVKEEKEEIPKAFGSEGKRFYRNERTYGAFTRTIPLPSEIKSGEVEATLKDGILELRLPKKEIKEMKKVKINVK